MLLKRFVSGRWNSLGEKLFGGGGVPGSSSGGGGGREREVGRQSFQFASRLLVFNFLFSTAFMWLH